MDEKAIQKLRLLLGQTNLLVVDDTPIIRGIISGILEPLGLKNIIPAGDGEEAWRIMQGQAVDIVVADWLMPGVNGLELLRKMREDSRFADTPFIMITGMPDKSVVMEAMKLKVTDFMVKPIESAQLKQKILRVLTHKMA